MIPKYSLTAPHNSVMKNIAHKHQSILQRFQNCLVIPRTSSSFWPFLAEGCAPDWRTTEPRPSSSSLSNPASLGSNAELHCSSLKEQEKTTTFSSFVQVWFTNSFPVARMRGSSEAYCFKMNDVDNNWKTTQF